MKSRCFSTLLIALLTALPAAALYRFEFPSGLIGRTYTAETRLKKDNSPCGRSTTKFEKTAYGGKDYLVLTSRATGTIQDKPFTSEIVRYFLLESGRISSYSIKGQTTSNGQPWTDYTISFDWPGLAAAIEYRDFQKKENVNKSVRIEPSMVAIQDLDLYLPSLPARGLKEEKLKALLPNGQTFGFLLKLVDRPETLDIKGQTVSARRIELKPDLGLLSIVIPNVNYWVRNEPPYELVRYSGLISGPGSPDVVQEIAAGTF